jgi:hypothetical protein
MRQSTFFIRAQFYQLYKKYFNSGKQCSMYSKILVVFTVYKQFEKVISGCKKYKKQKLIWKISKNLDTMVKYHQGIVAQNCLVCPTVAPPPPILDWGFPNFCDSNNFIILMINIFTILNLYKKFHKFHRKNIVNIQIPE